MELWLQTFNRSVKNHKVLANYILLRILGNTNSYYKILRLIQYLPNNGFTYINILQSFSYSNSGGQKLNLKIKIMGLVLKLPPIILARTDSGLDSVTSNPAPCLSNRESNRRHTKCLGPCHSCRDSDGVTELRASGLSLANS